MTPEQAALKKASESLAAAHELAPKYPDFAVSRAYYAMFYAATALLFQKGFTFKRHSAVISAFGREFAKNDTAWRTHHQNLISAESLRNEGDYDLYTQVLSEEVEATLEAASNFIDAATNHLAAA